MTASGTRYWEFGLFDAEAADMDCDFINGRSILIYGNLTDQVGSATYNPEYGPIGTAVTGGDPYTNAGLIDVKLAQLKARLGQIPVLLRVDFTAVPYSTGDAVTWHLYRMYESWDIGDSNNRYSDITGTTTWYQDAYFCYPGQDRATDPTGTSATADYPSNTRFEITITELLQLALRNNEPVRMFFHSSLDGTFVNVNWKPTLTYKRPTLRFWYFYPVEFYDDDGGEIDYASPIQDEEDGHYYAGAVEAGVTGTPTKCHLRNYTTATQQVEIFDDHPEWATPVQRAGTGTGQLDYVTLSDVATSQKYTVQFYSATQFEVLAEAYRDNPVGNHPQYDANASWRGTVSTNFTSPSGGLTIPSVAWQSSGILSGDEFEFGVRGNTTDTSWPADSNDQMEMTYDNAGVADATAWRPMVARREKLTNTVVVDGTSKFFPIRHLVPADWPISNKCFVHDQTNIDEGTISSTQERALGADSFTGSGTDDLVAPTGNYNGNENRTYRIQIDANGTPDTFSWSRDGTTTWVSTGVNVQSSSFELEDGVWISWSATTGHTIGDYWTFDADTWGVTIGGLTSGSNSYAAGSIVATTLPIRDLAPAVYSTVNADSGDGETPANRLYLDSTTGYSAADDIFVQALATGNYESATIAAGGVFSTYLELEAVLANTYVAGDFCTKKGAGEAAYWIRPVATITTVEELKRLRSNARML